MGERLLRELQREGGESGTLALRNVGFGAFGQGWSGHYTILQGMGIFDGAEGRITSGTGGVVGTIILHRQKAGVQARSRRATFRATYRN